MNTPEVQQAPRSVPLDSQGDAKEGLSRTQAPAGGIEREPDPETIVSPTVAEPDKVPAPAIPAAVHLPLTDGVNDPEHAAAGTTDGAKRP